MNPAWRQARFRAELPHSGLPESFSVVSARNRVKDGVSDRRMHTAARATSRPPNPAP